ncbi:MAG: hypothetical protein FJW30_03025 [Acidobacteria bacterium]|nr:hypothetical protein [Acidobacteriota bacterium]
MDPGVKSKTPGRCPRCGMLLELGLPESLEYRLAVEVLPKAPLTTGTARLRFQVLHPKTGRRVEKFREIHEKLFHLFLISEDLTHFAHEHPEPLPGGLFDFMARLPVPGFYRLLADFYPDGGTPQLLPATLHVRGPRQAFEPAAPSNLRVKLRTEPAQPIAGLKTMLFFELDPFEGVTPWLGAWGHLLVASADLVDLVHHHPVWEPYQGAVQFNMLFPKPGRYQLWAQFQREGVVNTAPFSIDVKGLG